MSVTFSVPTVPFNEDDVLNVSNGNFYKIMGLLGFDPNDLGYCGRFEGPALSDLHARLEFAMQSLALMPDLDAGQPWSETIGERGARMIDCGMSEGYYQARLSSLYSLVEGAIRTESSVSFG